MWRQRLLTTCPGPAQPPSISTVTCCHRFRCCCVVRLPYSYCGHRNDLASFYLWLPGYCYANAWLNSRVSLMLMVSVGRLDAQSAKGDEKQTGQCMLTDAAAYCENSGESYTARNGHCLARTAASNNQQASCKFGRMQRSAQPSENYPGSIAAPLRQQGYTTKNALKSWYRDN